VHWRGSGLQSRTEREGSVPAGNHLLGLMNQVLDLSKIEAGKLELRPQIVQLVPLIDEVVGSRACRESILRTHSLRSLSVD
jgi:signal transduction histidine kinase